MTPTLRGSQELGYTKPVKLTVRGLMAIIAVVLAGCGPSQAELAATAQVAIQETQTARPTKTALPPTATVTETATPAATATPALEVGSWQVRPADTMTMMYVPAGSFMMGNANGFADQGPLHSVYLDAFWIDKTEVTLGQYALCVGAGKCKSVRGMQSPGSPCVGTDKCQNSAGATPSQNSPVINAEWRDANAYCSYVGARLPTEAEWEKAARGTDGRMYPWGDKMDNSKLSLFTWDGKMPPVGGFPAGASPYGVLDMAGGAFEWVADWYSPSYYSQSPSENPQGPASGKQHVIRGGWWEYCPAKYVCPGLNPSYSSTMRNGTGNYGRGGDGPAWIYYPGAGFRCAEGLQAVS